MRGQLHVQQVGDMQVHQLPARDGLQGGLDLRQLLAEEGSRAGDPIEARFWRAAGQIDQFKRRNTGPNMENAERGNVRFGQRCSLRRSRAMDRVIWVGLA